MTLDAAQIATLLEGTTPGPWQLAENDETLILTDALDEEGNATMVADVLTRIGRATETNFADARLIAAAPDLARAALDAIAAREAAEAGAKVAWEQWQAAQDLLAASKEVGFAFDEVASLKERAEAAERERERLEDHPLWEEFLIAAKSSGENGEIELFDIDDMHDAAWNILKTLSAEVEALRKRLDEAERDALKEAKETPK
jgi:hypothetical protein